MDYKIQLKKLTANDIPLFYRWWNLKKLRKLTSRGISKKMSKSEVDKILLKAIVNKNRFDYIIFANNKPIGHILLQYKTKRKRCELYIAIGEMKYWDKGIGTRAIKMAIKRFFKEYRRKPKLYLEVHPDNYRAIRCYEKCGFVKTKIVTYKNFPKLLQMIYQNKKDA